MIALLTLLLTLATTTTTSVNVRTSHRSLSSSPINASTHNNSSNSSLSAHNATSSSNMEGESAIADGDGDGSSPMADQLQQGGLLAKKHLLHAALPPAKSCPSNCFGNGFCVNGECACKQGYQGTLCGDGGAHPCKGGCGSTKGTGSCDLSSMRCKCKAGYAGLECDQTTCLNDCSGKGFCLQVS